MASAWPELDELIRALAEVSTLPNAENEPSLSEATMAVSKASADLRRAAAARGRSAEAARERARQAIEVARTEVERARRAIASARRASAARSTSGGDGAAADGAAEATCPACGGPFIVRYRAPRPGPTVAFPVACPVAECDGVANVEYPQSATDVRAEAVPA